MEYGNRRFKELLIKHEGLRLKPYKCSAGKLTIGVGRNLADRGITATEAEYLLDNDIVIVINECRKKFAWFEKLNENRQIVVTSMVFNLGMSTFLQFRKTISHIEAGNFYSAAIEMLDSRWAKQVGSRAHELSVMMRLG